MTYDPNDPPISAEVLAAIDALNGDRQPAPVPTPDLFSTPEQRIESHLGRIAAALELIAADVAAIDNRDSARVGYGHGCHR